MRSLIFIIALSAAAQPRLSLTPGKLVDVSVTSAANIYDLQVHLNLSPGASWTGDGCSRFTNVQDIEVQQDVMSCRYTGLLTDGPVFSLVSETQLNMAPFSVELVDATALDVDGNDIPVEVDPTPLQASLPYLLTPSGSLIAIQGDGSSCTVTKIAGPRPAFTLSCTAGNAGLFVRPTTIYAGMGMVSTMAYGMGDVQCLVGMNTTSNDTVIGNLGGVTSMTAVISCSVNIRAAGVVTGQAKVPDQVLIWP